MHVPAVTALRQMYERLVAQLRSRPAAIVMTPHEGNAGLTYRELIRRLGAEAAPMPGAVAPE